MVATNFDASLKLVLKEEGGNVDDPHDRGGRTSRGVTQRVYDGWRRDHGLPTRDVFHASTEEVADIYRGSYWGTVSDQLPIGIDYEYFDFAVNSGPRLASRVLQRAVGVTADGIIGPQTLAEIRLANQLALVAKYMDQRRLFFRSLRQPRFLKGWLNRANFVEKEAISMVKGGSV